MQLFLHLDISDDDVELNEIAEQCGYDLQHPALHDFSEPFVSDYEGKPCLAIHLHLQQAIDPWQLMAELRISLSHPSVTQVQILGLLPPLS